MGAQFDYDQSGNTTLVFIMTVLSIYAIAATINRLRGLFGSSGARILGSDNGDERKRDFLGRIGKANNMDTWQYANIFFFFFFFSFFIFYFLYFSFHHHGTHILWPQSSPSHKSGYNIYSSFIHFRYSCLSLPRR